MKLLYSTISSTTYNRAYLVKVWDGRGGLQDSERYGFAQFIYLTITGHLEACMGELIDRRLMYVRSMTRELRDKSVSYEKDGQQISHAYGPLYESLQGALDHFQRKAARAPLDNLSELFQDLFGVKMPDLLKDLHPDLKALAALRNVFAHGRDLWMEFDQSDANLLVLDQNPLKLPAERLYAAGILKSLRVDAKTHHEFRVAFYSDAALLHFLAQARRIEGVLKALLVYPPETEMPLMVSLPEIK